MPRFDYNFDDESVCHEISEDIFSEVSAFGNYMDESNEELVFK